MNFVINNPDVIDILITRSAIIIFTHLGERESFLQFCSDLRIRSRSILRRRSLRSKPPVQQFEIHDLPVVACNSNVIFFHILLVSFPNTIVNLYWNPFICLSINHLNFGPPGQTKFVFCTFT